MAQPERLERGAHPSRPLPPSLDQSQVSEREVEVRVPRVLSAEWTQQALLQTQLRL